MKGNEQMLKMMAMENNAAFGTDAWIEMENIRQTIGAYDRGEIELPPLSKADLARSHAVLFRSPTSGSEYTKLQIARFLGRTKKDGKEGADPLEDEQATTSTPIMLV